MQLIDRQDLKEMMEKKDVTVVEVLGQEAYNAFHLPGAINVPLSGDFAAEIQEAVPDKSQPVVVYCMDEDCDASPKAAERMDQLDYEAVYDYAAGKKDWREAKLPVVT